MSERPAKGFWRLPRRDFLAGAVGGAAAGAGAWFLAPDSWHADRLPFGTRLAYAQNGEDLVVDSILRHLDIEASTYLDIGAYDPIIANNTYFFYRKGGHGVLVEPNVDLTPTLKKERPRDVVLTAGVGTDNVAEADYYVTNVAQLNTFDKAGIDQLTATTGGKVQVVRTVKMPLLNVNDVIRTHLGSAPDYLSIDAEGLDIPILKTLDVGRYRPAVVCAEHSQEPERRQVLLDLMAGYGYTVRGQTLTNTVFVDKKRWP